MSAPVVIIGTGLAGYNLAREFRKLDPQTPLLLITADDGSIAGLLGASPGASTAVPIMIDLLGRCFPNHSGAWKSRLTDLIPSLGQQLDENPALADEIMGHTAKTLGIR